MSPVSVVATQSDTDGHDTASTNSPWAMAPPVHALAPPVGSIDVRIVAAPPSVG